MPTKQITSLLVPIKMIVNEGSAVFEDNNKDIVTPKPYLNREGHFYVNDDTLMNAIGYDILSVQEKYKDGTSEVTFTFEVEILKSEITMAQKAKYITTIVYPTLASYLKMLIDIASKVNQEVETKFKQPE